MPNPSLPKIWPRPSWEGHEDISHSGALGGIPDSLAQYKKPAEVGRGGRTDAGIHPINVLSPHFVHRRSQHTILYTFLMRKGHARCHPCCHHHEALRSLTPRMYRGSPFLRPDPHSLIARYLTGAAGTREGRPSRQPKPGTGRRTLSPHWQQALPGHLSHPQV